MAIQNSEKYFQLKKQLQYMNDETRTANF